MKKKQTNKNNKQNQNTTAAWYSLIRTALFSVQEMNISPSSYLLWTTPVFMTLSSGISSPCLGMFEVFSYGNNFIYLIIFLPFSTSSVVWRLRICFLGGGGEPELNAMF